MNKDILNVMVTGVGGGGVGEQIMKALRLSDNRYYIVGGDMQKNSRGFKLADVAYILPGARNPEYIPTLLKICKKHDIKVLFYGSEPELKVFSENRDIFEQNDIIVPLNPREVIELCMDKNKTMEWLKERGFAFPKSFMVKNKNDLDKVDFLPAVLKPSIGGGGSVNTFIAQTEDELEMFGTFLLKMYDEFIIQEYVGDYENEYTVGVMCDYKTGEYVNSIAVKKSIMSGLSNKMRIPNYSENKALGDYLVISNGVSQGEIGKFPIVTEQCKEIAVALGVRGPINIQCRLVKDKVHVFEINPRISGTTSLRALVGYNEPEMLIRSTVLDEKVTVDFPYKSGYIARGLDETLLDSAFMENIESSNL